MATKRTSATVPLGQQAVLAGGFIWSLGEPVTFSIKVQRQTNTNPDQWVTIHTIPPFTATVVSGLSTDYQTVYGQLIQFEPSESGQYRWWVELSSANSTASDKVYFAVVAKDAPRPAGGTLELVSSDPDTGVTLNYIAGVDFDHGSLSVTHSRTGAVTTQTGFAGANVVTDLDIGVWYCFQMSAFNVDDELGGVSNIVTAYLTRSVIVPATADDTPFHEIAIKNNPLGGSLITWGLQRTFCEKTPYEFKLQWAETVNGEWLDVETDEPLVDTYFAIDKDQRCWSLETESFYRVVLTTAMGNTYVSMAQQSNGVWSKRDWLIARDICRKEFLMFRKFSGMNVELLKRRIWGPRCPVCSDYDTREVGTSLCSYCWGTGILGGYWPGYNTWILDPTGGFVRNKEFNDADGKGIDENIGFEVRVLGYPHISSYDLVKDSSSTGRMFVLREVKELVNVRGVPIVYTAKIKQLPFNHFLYERPNVPAPEPEPEYKPRVEPVDEWLY